MKKLSEADRLAITKRLAVMDRNVVIGVREVAVIYNTTVAAIQQACSAMRVARGDVSLRLPQRVQGIGRRVGWLHGDVRDLLERGRAQAAASVVPADAGASPAQAPAEGQAQGAVPANEPTNDKKRMGRKRQA